PEIVSHIAAPVIILRTISGTDYGMFFRLNVGLYTAGNPTLFTWILPWHFTGKINWAETGACFQLCIQ
ncbi:MAG: hypothetical protein J7M32_05455, partial [Deltaproteobacteria bacterium]|nr:hypothetical protein [Deltaproteobacteria bacterium]